MAWSNPSIQSYSIPTEARPNNTFQVSVTVKMDGPDPWGSDYTCITRNLSITGWQCPVRLTYNGQTVAEKNLCIAPGGTRETTLSMSLPEGSHNVRLEVYRVGGNAYDLSQADPELNDDIEKSITVYQSAADPSEPSIFAQIKAALADILPLSGQTAGIPNLLIALGFLFGILLLTR